MQAFDSERIVRYRTMDLNCEKAPIARELDRQVRTGLANGKRYTNAEFDVRVVKLVKQGVKMVKPYTFPGAPG